MIRLPSSVRIFIAVDVETNRIKASDRGGEGSLAFAVALRCHHHQLLTPMQLKPCLFKFSSGYNSLSITFQLGSYLSLFIYAFVSICIVAGHIGIR